MAKRNTWKAKFDKWHTCAAELQVALNDAKDELAQISAWRKRTAVALRANAEAVQTEMPATASLLDQIADECFPRDC